MNRSITCNSVTQPTPWRRVSGQARSPWDAAEATCSTRADDRRCLQHAEGRRRRGGHLRARMNVIELCRETWMRRRPPTAIAPEADVGSNMRRYPAWPRETHERSHPLGGTGLVSSRSRLHVRSKLTCAQLAVHDQDDSPEKEQSARFGSGRRQSRNVLFFSLVDSVRLANSNLEPARGLAQTATNVSSLSGARDGCARGPHPRMP